MDRGIRACVESTPCSSCAEGQRRPLPPGLELSTYRIIQEALTNSRKHGAATTATEDVRGRPPALELCITDSGQANGQASDHGHGLIGMRERVALYGGRLDAGPRPEVLLRPVAVLAVEPP